MKKFTLFLVATLFSALSFAALNPYAYGLSSTLSADQTTLTVNYSLNATATAVSVVIMDGETEVKTVDCAGIAKGSYTIDIPTTELPKTKSLTWKVEVKGESVESPTKQSDVFKFYLPYGLDCDVDPESDYLGNWYVIEATKHNATGYMSDNVQRGLYAFDATLTGIKNKNGTYGFTGGVYVGASKYNNSTSSSSPTYVNLYRVVTSGGRVFIGRFEPDQAPIVEANPGDLDANFTEVIAAGKRVASIDAYGRGENLRLVMLDTDLNIHEYDLGTAKSISGVSRTIDKDGLEFYRNDGTIIYDNEGEFWLNQHRGTATKTCPTIAHLSTENGFDYNNVDDEISHDKCSNSGIAINPAGTELAVVGAGTKKLTIYTISKDNTGKISLTKKHTISTAGDNHTALSYDYAGNLYVANRSAETITFYAMPYSGMVSTPCASKYAFELQESVGTIYTVTATASPAEAGTVTGGGTYYEGETVTLTATPKTGYRFVNWSNSSTDAKLTFTASENLDITANFEICTYTLTSFSNDETKGTVSGAGTYNYGATATLEATPATGYKLLYWSDRSTTNPRTITMNKNEAISAYFVKVYDQEPTFTITKVWQNTNVPAATGDGFQAVGWDGNIYMQNKTAGKIITYSSAEDTGTDYATSGSGQQIAVDEAGNMIVFNAYFATGTPGNVLIYKKGSTTGKAVSFTLPDPAACHFFSASGDIYSASGGYVYFYCNGKTAVNRLKITNGAATAADVTTDIVGGSIYAGGTQNHVMVDIFGNLVTHARSNSVNWINVYTNECKTFTLPSIKFGTLGGCSFELGGKELWAYHAGATNYSSEWNIYNMTDGKFLSDEDFYAVDKANSTNNAANWLNVQVVDENTAYIYQFCPKKAVAVWEVKMLSGNLHTVTVVADNGTVDGNAGTYEDGATATLTAKPNTGYKFVNWTKEGTVVSTDATYTFTVTEDVTLVANFEALLQYTITATSNDAAMGTVTGGGDYYEGSTATLTATPVGGYVFEKWSDDNTDNPRNITVNGAAAAYEYEAIFKVAPARVFAYNLDVVDNGDETYTLSFIPNANATSGRVILYNDDTKTQIHEESIAGSIVKGVKSEVVISRSLLPETGNVTWAVELTGEQVEKLTLLTKADDKTNYGFNRPQGVAIDNNPASDYFGRIYIALPKAGGTYYTDKNYGIVVMDPLHNRLKSGVVSNGDVLGADGRYSMHRVAVNPTNGHVYYVRTSDSSEGVTGTAIYELTPDAINILTDGGTAKNVINGISEITNANSVCFDETGAMYVMANANYTNEAGSTGRVYKVIDGVATLFTPSSIEIASKDNAIVPDGKGGFWVAQHRNSLDGSNHLFHINTSGATDYYIDQNNNASLLPIQTYTKSGTTYKNASYRGQVAYYSIDENNGLVAYGGGAKVSVFKATYDGSGVPTLESWQTISLLSQSSKEGIHVDGIAFDYAGNIIVMSATDERMYQYALPIETANTSLVPSPTSKAIKLGTIYTVEVAVNDPAMGTATGAGEYLEGETATVTATANEGYRFANWHNGTEVVSTDKTYTFSVTGHITLTANFEPLPEIAYELNGGVWNKYGWTSKKDMYNALLDDWRAYSGSTRTNVSYEEQLGIGNSSKGIPTTAATADERVALWNLFTDPTYAPKWGWLATYVDAVAATQYKKMDAANGVKTQPTSAAGVFTFTIGNFFGEDKEWATGYIDAVDFTGAEAQPQAFQPTWGQSFPMPTQPTEEVILNAPYKEGYLFDGWYTTSDFSGAAVTTVDENTEGTLYAKWVAHFYTHTPNNKYGTICLPYASASTTGAYFYEVAGKEEGKVYLASVDALEAGVPYIFEKTASTITVFYTGEAVSAPQNDDANGLVGTFEEIEVPDGDYILYNDAFRTNEPGGTLNRIRANRAYLNMDGVTGSKPTPMPGRRYIGMDVEEENETTGFKNIQLPNANSQKLIINGQLIIIRDGEMYNAQGQKL